MPHKTKKILVQFEYNPAETRWLYRDEELTHFLAIICQNAASAHTAGPIPAVTVTAEEQPESPTHETQRRD